MKPHRPGIAEPALVDPSLPSRRGRLYRWQRVTGQLSGPWSRAPCHLAQSQPGVRLVRFSTPAPGPARGGPSSRSPRKRLAERVAVIPSLPVLLPPPPPHWLGAREQ
ncbi:hypothetical protein AAFF_G00207030 [Aldrovandia affinis]|uniref:Uncharacterized protein n=1 Tax=Aldrovandia affinis TaxID=143900 RepID=A0AAD7RHL8_9TELE|nr:hypothetical protein AAFF_G00207030 [Aldrovandia affinis]